MRAEDRKSVDLWPILCDNHKRPCGHYSPKNVSKMEDKIHES